MAKSSQEALAAVFVRDPLSEVTRKTRRLLLVVSMIGIAVAWTGMVPTKVTALGIEFNEGNRQSLLWMLACVNGYFFFAFLSYALSDYTARALDVSSAGRDAFRESVMDDAAVPPQNLQDAEIGEYDGLFRRSFLGRVVGHRRKTAVVRQVIDFLVPIVVALWAIFMLLATPLPKGIDSANDPTRSRPVSTSPILITQSQPASQPND